MTSEHDDENEKTTSQQNRRYFFRVFQAFRASTRLKNVKNNAVRQASKQRTCFHRKESIKENVLKGLYTGYHFCSLTVIALIPLIFENKEGGGGGGGKWGFLGVLEAFPRLQ